MTDAGRSPHAVPRQLPGYDDRVSDPTPTPIPTPEPASLRTSPGERRRLAHPPSDRYPRDVVPPSAEPRVDPAASVARGVAIATLVAIAGAVAIVVIGGVMTLTAGLLVVAGSTGGSVGLALRWGAGGRLTRRRRIVIALGLAIGSVALGQSGLWQYARTEGGVLALLDYLGEVFGPLVPLQFASAATVAWLAAR